MSVRVAFAHAVLPCRGIEPPDAWFSVNASGSNWRTLCPEILRRNVAELIGGVT